MQPFAHACSIFCRAYKYNDVTRHSGSCTPTSGVSVMAVVVSLTKVPMTDRTKVTILTWDSTITQLNIWFSHEPKDLHINGFSPRILTRDPAKTPTMTRLK